MIQPVPALLIRTLLSAALLASATSQIPCWSPNLGNDLGLGDESVSAGQSLGFSFSYGGTAWTDIQVCDNGYITLGATGGLANFTPSANTLVADPFGRICPFWIDLDPGAPGGGSVFFNAVPANGGVPAHAIITWDAVFEYLGSTPHTFQLVLIDGGAMRCSFGTDLSANTSSWLIGASPGNGGTLNTVNFTALPILTAGNPTLHEENLVGNGSPLAGSTLDWTPDGSGGFSIDPVLGCASSELYGSGCGGSFTSFYEWFASTPAIDLSNSAFKMALNGGGYTVTSSNAAFMSPTITANNLNLTDDSETSIALAGAMQYPGGSTFTLNVGSNGVISIASNGAAFDFSPTATEFLNWPETSWAVWRDFIPGPTGSGTVWFDEIGNRSIITWDAVVGYVGQSAGTTPSTFQFQFNRANGEVTVVFQSMDTVSVNSFPGGEGWVIGYSAGGPSIDPGNSDLSVVLGSGSIVTSPTDLAPLAIDITMPPLNNTVISLVITNITPNAIFAAMVFGFARYDPGIELSSFGMPGCFQYNPQLAGVLHFPFGANTITRQFALPNFPGGQINVQAGSFDPAAGLTPLGAVSSNGIELTLGQ